MNIRFPYRFAILLFALSFILSACRQGVRQDPAQGPSPSEMVSTPTAAPTQIPEPSPTSTPEALTFQTGRNDYTIQVDGFPREFIVYVPVGYDPGQPTPVVFMIHGSNQSGNIVYENTMWNQQADENNFIVVYPTAWAYPLIGERGLHEKWNDVTLKDLVQPGTELREDVHFVRVMLDLIRAAFNVDDKRIFASGFSNGGSFVSSRLLIEMNDTFAAFGICGSGVKAAHGGLVDQAPEGIVSSLYTIVGTEDEKIYERSGHPLPFPMDASEIIADELFGPTLVNTATILSLDPNQYQLLGSNPNHTAFLFNQSLLGADNEYIFQMVRNMGHVYPSADNNRYGLDAANIFWEFFLRHPLK